MILKINLRENQQNSSIYSSCVLQELYTPIKVQIRIRNNYKKFIFLSFPRKSWFFFLRSLYLFSSPRTSIMTLNWNFEKVLNFVFVPISHIFTKNQTKAITLNFWLLFLKKFSPAPFFTFFINTYRPITHLFTKIM